MAEKNHAYPLTFHSGGRIIGEHNVMRFDIALKGVCDDKQEAPYCIFSSGPGSSCERLWLTWQYRFSGTLAGAAKEFDRDAAAQSGAYQHEIDE